MSLTDEQKKQVREKIIVESFDRIDKGVVSNYRFKNVAMVSIDLYDEMLDDFLARGGDVKKYLPGKHVVGPFDVNVKFPKTEPEPVETKSKSESEKVATKQTISWDGYKRKTYSPVELTADEAWVKQVLKDQEYIKKVIEGTRELQDALTAVKSILENIPPKAEFVTKSIDEYVEELGDDLDELLKREAVKTSEKMNSPEGKKAARDLFDDEIERERQRKLFVHPGTEDDRDVVSQIPPYASEDES